MDACVELLGLAGLFTLEHTEMSGLYCRLVTRTMQDTKRMQVVHPTRDVHKAQVYCGLRQG